VFAADSEYTGYAIKFMSGRDFGRSIDFGGLTMQTSFAAGGFIEKSEISTYYRGSGNGPPVASFANSRQDIGLAVELGVRVSMGSFFLDFDLIEAAIGLRTNDASDFDPNGWLRTTLRTNTNQGIEDVDWIANPVIGSKLSDTITVSFGSIGADMTENAGRVMGFALSTSF
jgi:hypothetical protein